MLPPLSGAANLFAKEHYVSRKKREYKIVSEDGSPCHRCGRPTQVREHDGICEKQLRQPFYYSRWFYCMHKGCKTKIIHREEFKVWNTPEDNPLLEAVLEQLRPRD
jgi:hypothetical protein